MSMKPVLILSRIMLGLAYVVYGYLHFAHTTADAAIVPHSVGHPLFWVILIGICWWAVALSFFTNILTRLSGVLASVLLFFILFFVVLPDFNGVSSWLSMASVFGLIGGSLQVAVHGRMWYGRKNL